mgnify:CR=1 FL=1
MAAAAGTIGKASGTKGAVKKVVLAYSGGLDTSFCVPWLAETYGRPIVTLTVNTGGIDAEAARVLEERPELPGHAAERPARHVARVPGAGHAGGDRGAGAVHPV